MRKRVLPIFVLSFALSFSTVAKAGQFAQDAAGPIFLAAAIVVGVVAVPYLIVKEGIVKPVINAVTPEHDKPSSTGSDHDDAH